MPYIDERIRAFEPFWGKWRIRDIIGRGSFGQVYTVVSEDFGVVYEDALKHISIPRDELELNEGFRNGSFSSAELAQSYYKSSVQRLQGEIDLMYKFRGHSHIVNYQDHLIVEKNGMPGYDVFIRMEKLKTLPQIIQEKGGLERDDIIKIGMDVCDALKTVHKSKTLHRDIKPENVFFGKGEYKLGDFGVARTLSQTSRVTAAGTPNYMAPEIYRYEAVNSTADIYSLGVMLYRLLNGNRAPFLPADRNSLITPRQEEEAISRRMQGDPLPRLPHVDDRLMNVILKSCAFRPEDRYQSAEEMSRALWSCGDGTVIPPKPVPVPVPEPVPAPAPEPAPKPVPGPAQEPAPKPVPEPAPKPAQDPVPQPDPMPVQPPVQKRESKKEKRPRPKWLLPAVLAGVAALIVLVLLLALPGGQKPMEAPVVEYEILADHSVLLTWSECQPAVRYVVSGGNVDEGASLIVLEETTSNYYRSREFVTADTAAFQVTAVAADRTESHSTIVVVKLKRNGDQADPDDEGANEPEPEPEARAVMSHVDYVAAQSGDTVCVEASVQAKSGWRNNHCTIYAQNEKGGYLIKRLPCTLAEYEAICVGTTIRVEGVKGIKYGENYVSAEKWEVQSGSHVAAPKDISMRLNTDLSVNAHQHVTITDVTVEQVQGDVLTLSCNGVQISCVVDEELIPAAQNASQRYAVLTEGATVDVVGFLGWNDGPELRIIEVQQIGAAPCRHQMSWRLETEADCGQPGAEVEICDLCGERGKTRQSAALPHAMQWIVTRAATCSEEGVETETCSRCGEKGQTRRIAALSHNMQWRVTQAASCTADGLETETCIHCGMTGQTRRISALTHQYVESERKRATCADGYIIRTCPNCGDSQREILPATGEHDVQWTVVRAATCTEEGLEEERCSGCSLVRDRRVISAPGHDLVRKMQKAPSYTSPGLEIETCNNCSYKKEIVIPAIGR